MANYHCQTRTNYFRVKDEKKFLDLMSNAYCPEDTVTYWTAKNEAGNTTYAFGAYGAIEGLKDPVTSEYSEDEPHSYDAFVARLKECVANDDAIIIFEVGHEKLQCLCGYATIVTSSNSEFIDFENLAVFKAAEMLGYDIWSTRCYC